MAAARKDLVADVVTAVVIMAVDVTMDVGFPLGTDPVDAIFSGSSFFFAHAAATVLAATTAVATEMVTAAGSLSSFCFSAVDGEMAAAADLSFPHMKKGCLLSPFQKIGTAGIFPCPLFQAYSKSILMFPCFFFNHALGKNSFLKLLLIPGMVYGLSSFFRLLHTPAIFFLFPLLLSHTFQIQLVYGISIYNKLFILSSHNFPS